MKLPKQTVSNKIAYVNVKSPAFKVIVLEVNIKLTKRH